MGVPEDDKHGSKRVVVNVNVYDVVKTVVPTAKPPAVVGLNLSQMTTGWQH
jgi:hypothetical protein